LKASSLDGIVSTCVVTMPVLGCSSESGERLDKASGLCPSPCQFFGWSCSGATPQFSSCGTCGVAVDWGWACAVSLLDVNASMSWPVTHACAFDDLSVYLGRWLCLASSLHTARTWVCALICLLHRLLTYATSAAASLLPHCINCTRKWALLCVCSSTASCSAVAYVRHLAASAGREQNQNTHGRA